MSFLEEYDREVLLDSYAETEDEVLFDFPTYERVLDNLSDHLGKYISDPSFKYMYGSFFQNPPYFEGLYGISLRNEPSFEDLYTIFYPNMSEMSPSDAYHNVLYVIDHAIQTARAEEDTARSSLVHMPISSAEPIVNPSYLHEETWHSSEPYEEWAVHFKTLGADDALLREIFNGLNFYQEKEKNLESCPELKDNTEFMERYQERRDKICTQMHHINQALSDGQTDLLPALKELAASFRVGCLELDRAYLTHSYNQGEKELRNIYGADLSRFLLYDIPRDIFTGDSFTEELPPAARLLFDEKEHLLETHGKWDPSYTYMAAKNLEKYGIRKQEIADILMEYAYEDTKPISKENVIYHLRNCPIYEYTWGRISDDLKEHLYKPSPHDPEILVPPNMSEISLSEAYVTAMDVIDHAIQTARAEEDAAHSSLVHIPVSSAAPTVNPLYLNEETWHSSEPYEEWAVHFKTLGADDALLREIFNGLNFYQEKEKNLESCPELKDNTEFMERYQERRDKICTQMHHINQALSDGQTDLLPALKEMAASFSVGCLELDRAYLTYSYHKEERNLQNFYGAELSERFLKSRPSDAPRKFKEATTLSDRIFFKEKEHILWKHKKWNPTYTVRTANKMAEQGVSAEDIADTLQKHAPDIQNLPNADHRQKAAEKIAASAVNVVRAEQKQQENAASR